MNPQGEAQQEAEILSPSSLEVLQRAEIDMQVTTAKKYPRDIAHAKKRMLSFATLDEETAESCFYTLRRKEKDGKVKLIQGPSVRLAEIAFSCYQNLRAGARIVDNDGRFVTSRGICHDLENNTLISIDIQRRITTSSGNTYGEDMQTVTSNAANSVAFRNAVFKVVPSALIKPIYEAARAVAVGTATTLSARRDKAFKRFDSMGVSAERVLAHLDKTSIENVDLADLEILIGTWTAIKDGDTTIDEAFPEVRGSRQAQKDMADGLIQINKLIAELKIDEAKALAQKLSISFDQFEPMVEAARKKAAAASAPTGTQQNHHAKDSNGESGGPSTTASEEPSTPKEAPTVEESGKASDGPSPDLDAMRLDQMQSLSAYEERFKVARKPARFWDILMTTLGTSDLAKAPWEQSFFMAAVRALEEELKKTAAPRADGPRKLNFGEKP